MDEKFDSLFMKTPVVFAAPGRVWDYEKIATLNDKDFKEFYLALMREYRDIDGWWGENKKPYCNKCLKLIPGPEMLRRFTGRTLDPQCFRDIYASERNDWSPIMQRYWDRVAMLDATVIP